MKDDFWLIYFSALSPFIPLFIGAALNPRDKSQVCTTWTLYFVLDFITLITHGEESSGYAVLANLMGFSSGSFIMAGILFYQKRFAWTLLEFFVTFLVVLCLFFKYYFGSQIALYFSVASETIVGGYLVFKTYQNPQVKYNLASYTLFLLVSIFTLIMRDDNRFENWGFPLSEIILNSISIGILIVYRIKKRNNAGYIKREFSHYYFD